MYIQNLPSMVVPHVLDPQEGERVLDMCASPGGKTTHVATLMKGTGQVIFFFSFLFDGETTHFAALMKGTGLVVYLFSPK
jgi:16S rRNA C967 or C1407 C5-methylase (RsmB/RsmF family)